MRYCLLLPEEQEVAQDTRWLHEPAEFIRPIARPSTTFIQYGTCARRVRSTVWPSASAWKLQQPLGLSLLSCQSFYFHLDVRFFNAWVTSFPHYPTISLPHPFSIDDSLVDMRNKLVHLLRRTTLLSLLTSPNRSPCISLFTVLRPAKIDVHPS